MSWRNDLRRTARDQQVAERVILAVEELLNRDRYLFAQRVGERALSHRLAVYVEAQFPGWDVDCEYDRDGAVRKTIPSGTGNDDDEGSAVLPDVVVHRRGDGGNHLVFEIKKSSNRTPDDRDLEKLRAYGRHLGYEHGVFIRFVVGGSVPAVSRAEFIFGD